VFKVYKARRVYRGHRDSKAHKVKVELVVLKAHRDYRELRVYKEHKV